MQASVVLHPSASKPSTPEKLLKVVDDIDTQGNVPLTRLTVLKKWFEHPGRLSAFGLVHGNGLNGPSRGKLRELVRFMFAMEAIEETHERLAL